MVKQCMLSKYCQRRSGIEDLIEEEVDKINEVSVIQVN
jgi:hypothetical protein